MRTRALIGVLLLAMVFAVPAAAAQTEAERADACLFPDVAVVCDLAIDVRFDDVFPGFADVALLVLGDIAAVALLVLVIWIVRSLRPFPTLRFKSEDRVKEVEPGGRVAFKFELENLRGNVPVEVLLERPTLPGYWTADLSARQELESGFLVPHEVADGHTIPLTSRRAGGNRAIVTLSVKAPGDSSLEETLDYSLRAVPVVDGRAKKGKAKAGKVTVLVSPSVPSVEITDVTHDPERIAPGIPVTTRVRVVNRGENPADGAAVVFYVNGSAVATRNLSRMESRAEDTVAFDWTPTPGENRIRVAVQ